MENLYAYIYIPSKKAGEKAIKKIISCEKIKKFNIENWKCNPNCYTNKLVKVKDGPNDEKIIKSTILHIGESYECVQKFVKTSGKRIKIPKLSKSILETSTGDSSNSAEYGELKQIQKKKKDTKLKKCLEKKNIDQNIIATYVENRKCEANNEIILQSSSPSNFAHSTFTENHQSLRSTTPVLELLDEQINNYVAEPVNCTTQENNKVALNGEIGNSIPLKNQSFQNEFIEIYDEIFDIDLKNQNIIENNTYLTLIDKGVYCNTRAYKDAFKTKDPQRFFTLINSGIYGYEDLSKRSVKEPKKNSAEKILSPLKKEVVEDIFYKFLKVKGFSISEINKHLDNVNKYHRVSISSAKKKLKRQIHLENLDIDDNNGPA